MIGANALAASSDRGRVDRGVVDVDIGDGRFGDGSRGGRLIAMGISKVTMQMIENWLLSRKAPQL
jgi:hypothetical protein